jgi:NCAIR mutase (PurE)-related protein
MAPVVGIIMGSDSDWSTMEAAALALAEFEVPFEVGVVSAHRTVRKMVDYATSAADRGLRVIITGAGGAAHLPGMVASMTPLPVIGVPVPLKCGSSARRTRRCAARWPTSRPAWNSWWRRRTRPYGRSCSANGCRSPRTAR